MAIVAMRRLSMHCAIDAEAHPQSMMDVGGVVPDLNVGSK
jgi:hypothetical protein